MRRGKRGSRDKGALASLNVLDALTPTSICVPWHSTVTHATVTRSFWGPHPHFIGEARVFTWPLWSHRSRRWSPNSQATALFPHSDLPLVRSLGVGSWFWLSWAWSRAVFLSVPTPLLGTLPPAPTPHSGLQMLSRCRNRKSGTKFLWKPGSATQNTPLLARWPLCNKVSFCLSAELLTSGRRGSQEVRKNVPQGCLLKLVRLKLNYRFLPKEMSVPPRKEMTVATYPGRRCVELDIMLGRGQVNFKLLVGVGDQEAVLAKWFSLSFSPSNRALISLPLFSCCEQSSKWSPLNPSSQLWPFWLQNAETFSLFSIITPLRHLSFPQD